jgi:hypothetical protein
MLRIVSSSVRRFLPLLLIAVAGTLPAQAQDMRRPLFDALSVGVGLNLFHGDIDQNPDNDLIKQLGTANMNLMVVAERSMGHFVLGIGSQYHRFTNRAVLADFPGRPRVDMANNLLSFDITAGYGFNIVRSGYIRLYAGVGPMLVLPEYYDFPSADSEGFEEAGTRFVLSFPVGIVIQDRVRIGMRIGMSDLLEGVEGNSGSFDMLSFINLGYRFWL